MNAGPWLPVPPPAYGGIENVVATLVPELRARGHEAVPVDLPAADASAGLVEYADTVVAAVGDRTDVVLVAQSMGALTAPLVCERIPVRLLVLLNAMVPRPGETGHAWWAETGHTQLAARPAPDGVGPAPEFDPLDVIFHDVPPDVVAEALARGEPVQSGRPFDDPWPLPGWPDVPTRLLQGGDDRFLPLEFQRRVVRERLGIDVEEMPGGHLLALGRPHALADRLEDCARTPTRG